MDYLELLRFHDDPVNWMYPLDHDPFEVVSRFARFVKDLSENVGISLRTETGADLQDAIYHSEVFIPVAEEPHPSVMFSRFGDLVTVTGTERLPQGWFEIIEELLRQHGYTFVPRQVLKEPYAGRNPGVDGFRTWFDRYFGV